MGNNTHTKKDNLNYCFMIHCKTHYFLQGALNISIRCKLAKLSIMNIIHVGTLINKVNIDCISRQTVLFWLYLLDGRCNVKNGCAVPPLHLIRLETVSVKVRSTHTHTHTDTPMALGRFSSEIGCGYSRAATQTLCSAPKMFPPFPLAKNLKLIRATISEVGRLALLANSVTLSLIPSHSCSLWLSLAFSHFLSLSLSGSVWPTVSFSNYKIVCIL